MNMNHKLVKFCLRTAFIVDKDITSGILKWFVELHGGFGLQLEQFAGKPLLTTFHNISLFVY
jgi:hypothetical protein